MTLPPSPVLDVLVDGCWGQLESADKGKALVAIAMNSRTELTVKKYTGAWTRWKQWAEARSFRPLPAQPLELCEYIHLVAEGRRSKAAAEEAVYSIAWVHMIAGLENPTKHPAVEVVMEGTRRLLAAPKVKKEPIRAEDLRELTQRFAGQQASLSDVRAITICLICFAAFLRYDELANIRYNDVKVTATHMEIRIRQNKMDQYRDGDTVLGARTGQSTCPVGLLERYSQMAGIKLLQRRNRERKSGSQATCRILESVK